ncbi:DUF3078 domain-containing protein [Rhodohalobacter mucosus]|uniref:DUF3078 domain-containing protein n=1 Tax=Rhodohalobacter mucosus TaxID=2079485 RepID=A0A316TLC6_9BACT|nr:DUF3078 domain-containing protein [Rhodohalobacter mucosus]PWN05383.1 hypothetical protein DDZ15_15055 [Rhodohalobacter mucosus]
MKKRYVSILFTVLILFISHSAMAQDAPAVPDSLDGWDYSWTFGINGSQAAYSNWSQGGVNTIAATGNSNFQALYKKDRFSYVFQFETRFGQTRTDGQGVRKTDDRLAVSNRFLYDLSEDHEEFKLFANINFRTQFAKGYDYEAGPNDEDVLISDFMAPGYFVQNAGVAYVPTPNFSAEAGFGLLQTIVNDESLSTQYGLAEGDTFRNEAGISLAAAYSMTLADNLSWSSSVETFTNVNKAVSSTDVFFLNELTGKINSFMNASLRLDLVYDDDFSDEIQVAQVLSLGVSFILI